MRWATPKLATPITCGILQHSPKHSALVIPAGAWRYAPRFSSDGKYLLAAYGTEIVLANVASGQELQVFRGHTESIRGLDLSPNGKYLLSGAGDGTARLWDIATGQGLRRFGYAGGADSVAFSSDSKKLLTNGSDGSVLLWDIRPHSELPTFNGQNAMLTSPLFTRWQTPGNQCDQ